MLDDALAIAHDAAKSCALALVLLQGRLGLPAAAATRLRGDANLIATVLMPQLEVTGTVAAIGIILTQDTLLAGTAMADAGFATDAAPAFYDIALYLSTGLPPTTSPAKRRSASLARALLACGEASMLAEAFVLEAQGRFLDRRSAADARARIAAAMDDASDRIAAAAGLAVFGPLSETARQATNFLVAEASELRPIVRVESQRSMPSSALAWALYGDPAQAADLVMRNRVGTPLFMPPVVEALAPDPAQ